LVKRLMVASGVRTEMLRQTLHIARCHLHARIHRTTNSRTLIAVVVRLWLVIGRGGLLLQLFGCLNRLDGFAHKNDHSKADALRQGNKPLSVRVHMQTRMPRDVALSVISRHSNSESNGAVTTEYLSCFRPCCHLWPLRLSRALVAPAITAPHTWCSLEAPLYGCFDASTFVAPDWWPSLAAPLLVARPWPAPLEAPPL
jgi:hypothetical protein